MLSFSLDASGDQQACIWCMVQMPHDGVNVTRLTKEDREEDASGRMGVTFHTSQLVADSREQTEPLHEWGRCKNSPNGGRQEFPLPTSQGIFFFLLLFFIFKNATGPRAEGQELLLPLNVKVRILCYKARFVARVRLGRLDVC